MKKLGFLMSIVVAAIICAGTNALAVEAKLASTSVEAGKPVTISGTIKPGDDLFVVISSAVMFQAADAPGPMERERLLYGRDGRNAFGDTAIPPIFYVITNVSDTLAKATVIDAGQTSGPFAFPPFKYEVKINKIKPWADIDYNIRTMLGPVNSREQWEFLIFTHETRFGINTISKERPVGGGAARMILADYKQQAEAWNEGASVNLDKATGKFSVTMTPYRHLAPNKQMAVHVNGQKIDVLTIEKSTFFFETANIYMNPLIVFGGAFLIGTMFVIIGAAGGLFTAAFQITILGTKGPVGINAGNTVKPTNLFLTMCSPITGLKTYFRERRFAWPVAIPFAIGIVSGAFFIGPELSAKYLNLAAFKFYLGFICFVIGIKLFIESLASSIAKKKAMKAIVQKFNAAVKEAKESGKAMQMGTVEFDKFHPVKFDMRFWGETFVAKPMLMLLGGVAMGVIASAFGVGGGFMFMPFMTTLVGYPMYLAVPIALAGTFATSIGGISKYVLMGYHPDWIMAALIAAGAMAGGLVGPKIQSRLPEILLKRVLACALILTALRFTGLIWFMR